MIQPIRKHKSSVAVETSAIESLERILKRIERSSDTELQKEKNRCRHVLDELSAPSPTVEVGL